MGKKLTEEQKAQRAETRKRNEEIKMEEMKVRRLASDKDDIMDHMSDREPTLKYHVGQEVILGARKNVVVKSVEEGGRVILCEMDKTVKNQATQVETVVGKDLLWRAWYDIQPKHDIKERFARAGVLNPSPYRLQWFNSCISGIISQAYRCGYDMDMDYQRGNVWSDEDEVALIDSIFNEVEIGKFVIIKRPYHPTDKGYEVLDGKQRFTALRRFYEGRFKYKGLTFHEMHPFDQNHFEQTQVSVAEVNENTTRANKLDYFLRLNTKGHVQSDEHIAYVRKLREDEYNV